MNVQKIVILVLLFAVAGCSRPSKDSSKVIIQLPNSQSKIEASDIDTSIIAPSSLADINCYALMVRGPEDFMNWNRCGRFDADKNFSPLFRVGPWIGGIPTSRSTLEIDLPSGADREFILIGSHAASDDVCKDLVLRYNPSTMSKLYILGTSEKTVLEPGIDKAISINMTFKSEDYFDSCRGPDFNINVGDLKPAKIVLVKDTFPVDTFAGTSSCAAVDVKLVDALDRGALYGNDLKLNLQSLDVATGTYTNYTTYETLADCHASPALNPKTDFTLVKDFDTVRIFIKPYAASNVFRAIPVDSSVTFTSVDKTLTVSAPSTFVYKIETPTRATAGICYPVRVTINQPTGELANSPAASASDFAVVTVSANAHIDTSNSCNFTSASTISGNTVNFTGGVANFSILFDTAALGTTVVISMERNTGPVFPIANSLASISVIAGSNISSDIGVIISGGSTLKPSTVIPAVTCSGPYYLTTLNEVGSPVYAGTTRIFQFTPSSSNLEMHLDANCSNSEVTTTYISGGNMSTPFYLKTESGLSGPAAIKFESGASGTYPAISRTFTFTVN
jgi:hypothetical protein